MEKTCMVMVSKLPLMDLRDRRVFLRADPNVPLNKNGIANDFRLEALIPTLDLLITKKARIILATHMGRPDPCDKSSHENLSTKILTPWFENHGYKIAWTDSLSEAVTRELPEGHILLLENMRFYEGEKSDDSKVRENFAHLLKKLADFYVNDAFALLHRHDTSITLLPELYKKEDKTVGLLIEKELRTLCGFFAERQRPFTLIIGGGKVKDKLPFLEKLLDTVDAMIILPAIAFTFLKAQGKKVGRSLVDDNYLEDVQAFLEKAQKKSVRILFPEDFLILKENLEGKADTVTEIPDNDVAIAVGPQTLSLYKKEIEKAKTIFVNGAMGLSSRPETMQPFYQLLRDIAQSQCTSIIGGGDSVAAVYACHLENDITYCSTGGGASLYLLTYGNLPALRCMI